MAIQNFKSDRSVDQSIGQYKGNLKGTIWKYNMNQIDPFLY